MKWFNVWLANTVSKGQEQRKQKEETNWLKENTKMAIGGAQMAVERGQAEGEDRISFELSTAVGGRILNVRRYDDRKDRHESQTYVIPNGEDVGERVAKIVNLEMFRG
jgi:hypothetical protein